MHTELVPPVWEVLDNAWEVIPGERISDTCVLSFKLSPGSLWPWSEQSGAPAVPFIITPAFAPYYSTEASYCASHEGYMRKLRPKTQTSMFWQVDG